MSNFVIYPPASYGSKGDEGMLKGALRLFSPANFSIINPDRGSWLPTLLWDYQNIDEISNDEDTILELVKRDYDLIVVGADVIDGSCGVQPSLARLNTIKQFASAGRNVFVFHSYRSGVQKEIKEFLRDLTLAAQNKVIFFLRDRDSLARFGSDYQSANALFFPDLALFCDELAIADEWLDRHIDFPNKGSMTVGLNISEHTFRASCIDHTDKKRQDLVQGYVRVLLDLFPESNFLIFTNDIRSYDNFWSDFDYALTAEAAFEQIGRPGQVRIVEPTLNYGENISILRRCDLIVTGRMHLALAAFRAGCVPVIITGKSYHSETFVNNIGMLDKASGMFNWLFGSTGLVVTSATQLVEIIKDDAIDIKRIKEQIGCRLSEIAEEAGALVKLYGFNSGAYLAPKNRPRNAKLKSSFDAFLKDIFYFHLEIRKNLRRFAAERDGQIANLNQALSERDGQISDLNQALSERDGQIANLNQALSERDGQISDLNQALSERDGQIANLNQALSERDGRIGDLDKTVVDLKSSRSWRITAPYRLLGTVLRSAIGSISRTGILSRLVVATLLLPSAVVFFGGVLPLVREMLIRRGAFAQVIAGQTLIREQLRSRSRLLRGFVFGTFSLAVRVQRAGSIKRSISNFFRIIGHEGLGGLRGRLIATTPGVRAIPLVSDVLQAPKRAALPEDVARRILVADYRVPRPDVSAGERATIGIVKDLCALGYEVVFLPSDMVPSPRYDAELAAVGVKIVTRQSGFDHSGQYLEKHGREFGTFYFIRLDIAEAMLPVARRVAPDARVIFHAPDLYFLRALREADLHNDPAARQRALQTRERELALMSRADLIVVVSPAEVSLLREAMLDTLISVFPALYTPIHQKPRPYAERKDIFFLGGFGHMPNVDAVQWFVAEVWPHVRRELPEVEFQIIGAEAPESVKTLGKQPGIKVVGYVPELDPVLETLRIGVAPLRYGAGIKGKVAVSMGAGIPCVCTDIAAEGMGIKNDVHALLENDPVRFAQAVVTLYRDETTWTRLARNGQSLVQERYGDAANRGSLLRVLDQSQALPISLFIDYCQASGHFFVPNPSAEAEVDVSIIIPEHNDWSITRACLASVVHTSAGSGVTYEVILVDDDCPDETKRAFEMFPGLRVVKKQKNLASAHTCNRVAKQARGRHILLIDHVIIVLPGWLENLYKLIETDSFIAITGSKLIDAEGEIIEAGVGLLSNGETVSIGHRLWVGGEIRSVRRREPIFNIPRETDFFSRAPKLIRRSFWDSVGGLDERFENLHYASADLAIKARTENLRVMYVPQSEAICFEHQSNSAQVAAAHADQQEQDRAEIIAKWRDVLEREYLSPGCMWYQIAAHGERNVPVSARERRSSGKLNVLYFSPFPSHPSNHGNQATIQQFAKRFQTMGHKVHFALLQSGIYSQEDVCAMQEAWDSFEILPNSKPLWADGNPIPFDGWYEEGLGERIRLLCEKYEIDVVFCSYIFQSKMLEFVPDHILKVIDTHDKMGDRYEMLRKNGQPLEFFSCTPEEEGAYLRRADVVVARRAEEASYFDSVTGCQSAIVIPHVEDPKFFDRSFNKLEKVGVVASANQINLAIVLEFLETINSRTGKQRIPFTVHIAGQVKDMVNTLPSSERDLFNQSWVEMHGFVPEIDNFYKEMDVIVSPVTMGTGINVKTVQAMAYGMPLLTTQCGSKGIETGDMAHQHKDLNELVENLLLLTKNPTDLNRLAMLSRLRYENFYQESDSMIRKLFSLLQSKNQSDFRGTSKKRPGLIVERNANILKEKIYQAIWNYYKDGDKGFCFSDPASGLKMDGAGAEAWVEGSIGNNNIHDDDYSVFKVFSNHDGVVFDIGANWGYSVASIWAMAPDLKIVSFEPILGYRGPLQRIKDLYGEKYDFRMVGLGSSNEVVKFAVPVINGIGISALTSASVDRNKGEIECLSRYIAEHSLQAVPESAPIEFSIFEFVAPIRRLDDVLSEDVDLLSGKKLLGMKVDAEGLEGAILRGAEKTLISHKPVVMLEGGNRYEGLTEFMEKLGYSYYERDGSVMRAINGMGMAANGFFFHVNHLEEFAGKEFVFK